MSVKNPIDLLPITRPLEDTNPPDDLFFYKNVVSKLIPDIIKLEATGIPIDLDKVKEVEKTVNEVLENVSITLENNPLVQEYLKEKFKHISNTAISTLEDSNKSVEDFYKPLNHKDVVHRSIVVNTYLTQIGKDALTMDKWTIKDLKDLNKFIASNFIDGLIRNNIKEFMLPTIETAMLKLAETKADIYNKNRLDKKEAKLKEEKSSFRFNPGSSVQKQEFFSYFGIESDNITKAGNPQWDKEQLKQLDKLLEMMIESEGVPSE